MSNHVSYTAIFGVHAITQLIIDKSCESNSIQKGIVWAIVKKIKTYILLTTLRYFKLEDVIPEKQRIAVVFHVGARRSGEDVNYERCLCNWYNRWKR